MNKKRIISAVLATALTVTAANTFMSPASSIAYAATEYKPGDEVKADFVWLRLQKDNTWEAYWPGTGSASCPNNVIIPQKYRGYPVTKIADSAFFNTNCVIMYSVEIPEGVTTIGKKAFFNSLSVLKSVNIPSTVTSIGSEAFYGVQMSKVVLPEGITRIEDGTFNRCDKLSSVTVPKGVTYIGKEAFSGCAFTSFELPPKLETIGASAFESCQVPFTTVPKTVETIGKGAFSYNKKMTEFTVPDTVKSFGAEVFIGNENLKTVVLPNTFTSIPDGTFNGCSSLTDFYISDNVTAIGSRAFNGCKSLKSIFIPKSVTSIGYRAFISSGITDIYYEGSEDDWDFVERDSSIGSSVKVHFDCKRSVGAPVEIKINAPDTVNTSNRTVNVTGNGVNKTLTIANGMLDVSTLANGTYTFTFSANNCAPRAYTVTVSNGTATGLSKVELNLYGDITGDGKINSSDVLKAKLQAKGSQKLADYYFEVADVTKDGKVNSTDVLKLKLHAKGSTELWQH